MAAEFPFSSNSCRMPAFQYVWMSVSCAMNWQETEKIFNYINPEIC